MDNRKKVILISLIVATMVLIVIIFWWLFFRPQPLAPTGLGQPTPSQQAINQQTAVLPSSSGQRVSEANNFPLDLKQTAATFAERLASYSSDQPDKNLDDLKGFMTAKMQGNLPELRTEQASALGGVYVGFDATALSTELTAVDKTTAMVLVNLQRFQYLGSTVSPKIFYQKLLLNFSKVGESWLVDSIKWQ